MTPGTALSYPMHFSYVNEPMHLLWNLPFFKMVCLRLIFSFRKTWAGNGSTNQYSSQLFYGQGDDTPHATLSQKCILWERGPVRWLNSLSPWDGLSCLIKSFLTDIMGSPVALMVKNLPVMQENRVRSLGWEDFLEKEIATHSSILAWRIPWTREFGGLQSMGLQRVGHDWATNPSNRHKTPC